MAYLPIRWLLLLAFFGFYTSNLNAAQETCNSNELCVTVQRCNETDDSGRGKGIGPRISRSCGNNMDKICCDREQLESWDAMMEEEANTLRAGQTMTAEEEIYDSCGVNMECVPRKLCKDNVIIEDGSYIINPRIGTSPCRRALYRCCGIDQRVNASHSPYVEKLKDFRYEGCGWSNKMGLIPDQDNYNYSTDVSLFGEFPWMMAIFTGRNQYLCGGTLIHPQLVLTSSHNIVNQTVDTIVVRAGEWDLNSLNEPHEHQMRRIRQIIRHEDFEPEVFFNDIALLVLVEPFELAPHIQPLCLPPPETPQVTQQFLRGYCIATGWGTKPNSDKSDNLLKRIDLPFVGKAECQGMLRLTILGRRFRLRPSFVCAGGQEGKDTCKGDGGSPLFCSLPGQYYRYQMAGIVSWGIECAQEEVPAVYTNVAYLRPWIDEKIKALNFTLDGP